MQFYHAGRLPPDRTKFGPEQRTRLIHLSDFLDDEVAGVQLRRLTRQWEDALRLDNENDDVEDLADGRNERRIGRRARRHV